MRRLMFLAMMVAATSALAMTAGTARAGLITGLLNGSCPAATPVFAPWGDLAPYYFPSNGGFESGAANWTLSGGASVVTQDNEPWYLAGFGSHALEIPAGGSATTNVCFGATYPGVRFFSTGENGSATIHVRVVSMSLLGVLSVLDGGTFTTDQSWDPSPKMSTLFSALGAPLGAKTMQLQFTVENGTAQIDDLFVDPYLTRS